MSCLFKNRIVPIEGTNECPICLEEITFFSKKEKLNCRCEPSRYFHKKCIKTWLKLKDVCPLCDTKVERKLSFWEKYFLGTEVFDPCDFNEEEIQNNIIEQIEDVFREDRLVRRQLESIENNPQIPRRERRRRSNELQRDIASFNERTNRLEEQLARIDESMRMARIRRNIRRREANSNRDYSAQSRTENSQ